MQMEDDWYNEKDKKEKREEKIKIWYGVETMDEATERRKGLFRII